MLRCCNTLIWHCHTLKEGKMATEQLIALALLLVFQLFQLTEGREFCNLGGYWCDTGHCCGNGECCTYYYELWWFWLVWFLIVFIIGFCVWQRKRFHPWRDTRCERTCSIQDLLRGNLRGFNFPDITPIPPCKLPSYAEIGDTVSFNTPPPPYTYFYLPSPTGIGPSTYSSTAVQTCLPGSRSPSESSTSSNSPDVEVPLTSGDHDRQSADHVVREIHTSGNSSGDCQYCGQSPPPFHNSQQQLSSDEAPPTYTQVVQISPDNPQGALTPTSSLIRVVPVLVPPSPDPTPVENTNSTTSVPHTPAAEHTALLSSGACTDSDSIADVQSLSCSTADIATCSQITAPDVADTEIEPDSPSDASSASSSTVVDMHVTPSGYSFVTRIR